MVKRLAFDHQWPSAPGLLIRPIEDTLYPVSAAIQGGWMCSERWHGLSTEPVPASAYVGSSKNLKDLKGLMVVLGEGARPYGGPREGGCFL